MSSFRSTLLLILLGIATFTAGANATPGDSLQKCVDYEPETVSLLGSVSRRTFLNANDKKEVVWVLKLREPICVNADERSDLNVKRSRVSDVQLVLEPEMFGKYRRLLGKKVRATGTLFGEHTAHHFTPVLLDVTEVKALP